jgi:hypothetical protein
MGSLLTLTLALTPGQADWEFRDEAAHAGRSLMTFRAVELAEVPIRPLRPEDRPPPGARFGLLPVGTEVGGLLVVWAPESGEVWLDGDGDGRFTAAERHKLGARPLELPALVSVRRPGGPVQRLKRTVVLRRAADGGLRYAVRGYVAGKLRLGGQEYAALLVDGNADGCFDGAAADRIWIDLNRDGQFDGLTEQFPLGRPLTVGERTYLFKPAPDGSAVEVRERPTAQGTLRLALWNRPGPKASAVAVQLVSNWGELVTVRALGEAVPLPVGRYTVESLTFELADAAGRPWRYRFAGERRTGVEVRAGRETVQAVLEGLRLEVAVNEAEEVQVTPTLRTPDGLYLVNCETGERGGEAFVSGSAAIRLLGAGAKVLDEATSGFR